MAKPKTTPEQLPASEPGAVPLEPETPVIETTEAPEAEPETPAPDAPLETPEVAPETAVPSTPGAAETLAKFRVQNLFQGFRPEDLKAGDIVEASEDEAAPYLGTNGVLVRIEDEA
jgi:hypothetical protein